VRFNQIKNKNVFKNRFFLSLVNKFAIKTGKIGSVHGEIKDKNPAIKDTIANK